MRSAVVAFLVLLASGYAVLEPWHGPIVLALSEQHGVTAADLPAVALLALAVAVRRPSARDAPTERRWWASSGFGGVSAIALGLVLLAGIFDPRIGSPLVPTGGGTFDGNTQHVDGVSAEPVGHWTHLAVTYDGSTYRLYVDGAEASRRSASGTILTTADPLWIGGNHPYGEYFHGVIDEVRVYGRALGRSEVGAAMSTPIARRGGDARGLAAAYGFNAGGGMTLADASGNGNTGRIRRAGWTSAGRFGRALRFAGSGEVVRVPASTSLNLRGAMTLMAWIKPSESQSGWRTVLARQTDAYFLTAGGGREDARTFASLDPGRFALVTLLAACIAVALSNGAVASATGRGRWLVPVALFVAGSVVDAALAPTDTLVGPVLVALWCAATSSHRDERLIMWALAAVFSVVTILSIAEPAAFPLRHDDGGVVRAAALGFLLATAGVLSLRHSSQTRAVGG